MRTIARAFLAIRSIARRPVRRRYWRPDSDQVADSRFARRLFGLSIPVAVLAAALVLAANAGAGTITNTGEVTIINGVLNVGQTTNGLRIVDDTIDGIYDGTILGSGPGSTGELRLQNGAQFTTLGDLMVGINGNGLVRVASGSDLISQGTQLGIRQGSWPSCCLGSSTTTSVIVEGPGSSWENLGLITMGDRMVGERQEIRLSDGASLTTAGARFDAPSTLAGPSSFNVTIEGTGTSWINSGSLIAGGQLNYVVRNGARAEDHGVSIGSDYSVASFVVDGVGSKWSTGSFRMGVLSPSSDYLEEVGGLFITNGGAVQSASAYLSTQTTETVHIDGSGSEWSIANELIFGGNAAGGSTRIAITGGATLRTGQAGMVLSSGFGRVLLDGPSSRWENAGSLNFGGGDGSLGGTLDVRNGASLATGETSVSCGGYSSSCGIRVSGPGSSFHSSGGLSIGGNSAVPRQPGSVIADGGGSIDVEDHVRVWQPGVIRLEDGTLSASSVVLSGGSIEGEGFISADVQNGGRVSPEAGGAPLVVSGSYGQTHDGMLSIVLADAGASSMLDVLGASVLDGHLTVEVASGFSPQLGEGFEVLRYGEHWGEFRSYSGLDLGGGMALAPEYGATSLVLRVVPEPSVAILLGMGLGVIAGTRRAGESS